MSASKTLNLLAVAHNYRAQGKNCLVIKARPGLASAPNQPDDHVVSSRCGLQETADIAVFPASGEAVFMVLRKMVAGVDCVLVDEAQFLSPECVDELRELSAQVPVICYGLRTDFRRTLFPGSRRLLEVADSIEEVKVTCATCNRKAIYNLRLDESGAATVDGEQVLVSKDRYAPACHSCYMKRMESGQ